MKSQNTFNTMHADVGKTISLVIEGGGGQRIFKLRDVISDLLGLSLRICYIGHNTLICECFRSTYGISEKYS